MQRATVRAIVLRTSRYREADLIVDLFGRDTGRFSAIARGARRSKRRFGGAFQMGARLELEARRAREGALASLEECTVYRIPTQITADLDAYYQLAFVLEVTRLTTRESPNVQQFELVCDFLDTLEAAPPSPEALILFEYGVLRCLGIELVTAPAINAPFNGLSLKGGGVVNREDDANAIPISPSALKTLSRLWSGDGSARFSETDRLSARMAMGRLWHEICGIKLRSHRFLEV